MVRRQFDVAAFNASAEQPERFARARLNFGGVLGTRAELFRVEQDFIDARGRRLKINFLVDRAAVLLSLGPAGGGCKTAEQKTDLAARECVHVCIGARAENMIKIIF